MPSVKLLPCLLAALLSLPAQAAWQLDKESSRLSYTTTKQTDVAEVNRFRSLAGSVDDAGKVQVLVRMESVDSGIPLRDERLRKQLFDVEQFALAQIDAQLDIAPLLTLAAGAQLELRLPLTVNLHGHSHSYNSELLVTRLDDRRFQVVSLAPLVLSAADFGLTPGVETLRKLAGLKSISLAVPVSAVLIFTAG
ncbi:MAG: YceI family protein [Pseudomonas sp.]|uniref:YceI family protein n=1 Tax=Pseudomonas sp. TaxID=306 RepID=UPI0027377ADB|nr:YceI family protein [Pseudomonas sp.]MDP3847395.1 YceI family protein [Pseudomonas sp.]